MRALRCELGYSVYPSAFEFHSPSSIDEALRLLSKFKGAKLLAGGHSLVPMMKVRLANPPHLIDLSKISELRGVTVGERITIGATTTHWEVQSSETLRRVLPFLSEVAGDIADPQVRNRGTIGGSLAHADPAADYPASMLALKAELVCVGPETERIIPIDEWFVDLMTTALDEHEILKEIRVPLPPRTSGVGYVKHHHPASRFALAGVAAVLTTDAAGICTQARMGVTGVGLMAFRPIAAERTLVGQALTPNRLKLAAELIDDGIEVEAGFQMKADEKRHLAQTVAERALSKAAADCAAVRSQIGGGAS